jgi:hypothetical protein
MNRESCKNPYCLICSDNCFRKIRHSHHSKYLKESDSNIDMGTNQPPHINRIGQQQEAPFKPVDTTGLF